MPLYSVNILPSALKDLASVPSPDRGRIVARIDALAREPRPPGSKVLRGQSERRWRIRVGNCRIIYSIEDRRLVVLVVMIGHRREVYR